MKISELTTKSFLGKDNIPANSYVLVNYAEGANDTPVTYKATIEELGNAIAKDLQLVSTYNGKLFKSGINSQNNAYTSSTMGKPMYVSNSGGIHITHENGDKVSGIVLYDDTQAAGSELGYFSGTAANSWTPISVGGGGGGSTEPTTIDDESYVLYDETTNRFAIYDSNGDHTVLGSPVFYDFSGGEYILADAEGNGIQYAPTYKDYNAYMFYDPQSDMVNVYDSDGTVQVLGSPLFYYESGDYITFLDVNGNDLEIEPPAEITLSESTYSYELYASGVAAIVDSSGDNVDILGRPLFYNDTTHKVGYYTSQGSFTEVTL